MKVNELRLALEKLEAQGFGNLDVVYTENSSGCSYTVSLYVDVVVKDEEDYGYLEDFSNGYLYVPIHIDD